MIGVKRTNNQREDSDSSKRLYKERCIIHCTDDTSDLVSLKDEESWKTLFRAANIRNHQEIIDISKTVREGEIPPIRYHRKCRSVFTMKKLLDSINRETANPDSDQQNRELRLSIRGSPEPSTTYKRTCIFCEKQTRYLKGTKNKEPLVQCRDMRADNTIRKIATKKHDSKILAIVSRELVAAEACYHRSCYRSYKTRSLY